MTDEVPDPGAKPAQPRIYAFLGRFCGTAGTLTVGGAQRAKYQDNTIRHISSDKEPLYFIMPRHWSGKSRSSESALVCAAADNSVSISLRMYPLIRSPRYAAYDSESSVPLMQPRRFGTTRISSRSIANARSA
jgi:hypothetical protein